MGVREVAERTKDLAGNGDRNGNIPLTAGEFAELQQATRDLGAAVYSLRSRLVTEGVEQSIVEGLTKRMSYAEYCALARDGV